VVSQTARWFGVGIVLMGLVGGMLLGVGCGDKATSPKVSGTLPYSLSGIWQVSDVAPASCYASFGGELVGSYVDTICVDEPDFGIAEANEAWLMFLQYDGVLPGRWTEPVWDDWSVTLDSTVNAFFAGHASATLEECDFKIRIYTAGAFDEDTGQWKLKRTIERVEGRDCGHHGDDTTLYCTQYKTTLERIGDAPAECTSSNNVIGPVQFPR